MHKFVAGLCRVVVVLLIASSPALAADTPETAPAAAAAPAAKPEEGKAAVGQAPAVQKDAKTAAERTRERYFFFVVMAVAGFVTIALALLKGALKKGHWSVAHALSEDATPAAVATPAAGGNAAAAAASPPQLVPSSSRLIAFIGMLVMVAMFLGLGLYILYAAFFDQNGLTAVKDVGTSYFLPGSALFAPYAFNKVTEAFKQ